MYFLLFTIKYMAFLPKPGEEINDSELDDLSGDDDDRLRQEYLY